MNVRALAERPEPDKTTSADSSSGGELDLTPASGFVLIGATPPIFAPTPYHGVLTLLSGREVGRVVAISDELIIGRARECSLRIEDEEVSRRHARIRRLTGSASFLIEDLGSRNGTFVNGTRITMHELHDGERLQLGPSTYLRFSTTTEAEKQILQRLFEWSVRDPFTGVYNRRHFDERLEAEVAYAWRHDDHLALLMLDVDDFKSVNDTHGHPAGDTVIKSVADTVASALRKEDVLARYGGDELAVIVRGVATPGPVLLAERLRTLIDRAPVEHSGTALHVHVSVGVATCTCVTAPPTAQALLATADRRLYAAKLAGKNCVVGTQNGAVASAP